MCDTTDSFGCRPITTAIAAGALQKAHRLSFSGYLLPWDQLAIWAVTVGANMARATPMLGHEGPFSELLGMKVNNDVRFAMLGGNTVGQATLLSRVTSHFRVDVVTLDGPEPIAECVQWCREHDLQGLVMLKPTQGTWAESCMSLAAR